MNPIDTFTGRLIPLPIRNIDTDQIIPARFLKTIDKKGLGKNLFNDWRYDEHGTPKPDFILNQPRARGASILLAGDNFGCGSSREHAPWALMGFGFRAVISTSFADIFQNNCLKNGILPIIIDESGHTELLESVTKDEDLEITISLSEQVVYLSSGRKTSFPIDPFSKKCLLAGIDQLGYLQQQSDSITKYETTHPRTVSTL